MSNTKTNTKTKSKPPPGEPKRFISYEQPKPRFISFAELRTLYGETRSRFQLRCAVATGEYPAPKQLSAQRIGWETKELDRYYDARPVVDYAPTAA